MQHIHTEKSFDSFWSSFHQKNKNRISTLLDIDIEYECSLPKKSKILDIGFGNGENLILLKEKGYEDLQGVEEDCEVVVRSSHLENQFGIKIYHTSEYDQFHDFSIDYILLFGVFSTITDFSKRSKLLNFINRVLSPSGSIFLYDYIYDIKRTHSEYIDYFDQEFKHNLNFIYPSWSVIPYVHYTIPQLKDIFAGYVLSEIRIMPINSIKNNDNQGLFITGLFHFQKRVKIGLE